MIEDLGFHRNGNYIGFSPAQEQALKAEYESGKTCVEIAKRFGISSSTVRSRMKEFGVQLRQGKRRQLLSNEQLDQLVRMRFGGHMWKAIARHFDKSETYITEQFKKRTAYMTELQEVAIAIHQKHMDRWPLTHEQAVTLAKEQLPKDETTTIIYHLATELHRLNDVHPSA